jgi:distribution and morphology protein 12
MNSLTLTPQSNPDLTTRPSSQHQHDLAEASSQSSDDGYERTPSPSIPRMRDKSPEDIQVVSHVQYSGDIKMSLTADILLDYPMPSFVGIPLKLNITGLTFDGVAILAYIKKRAHFCFLSPEDADALIGGESNVDALQSDVQKQEHQLAQRLRVGGLLEHIKVESAKWSLSFWNKSGVSLKTNSFTQASGRSLYDAITRQLAPREKNVP